MTGSRHARRVLRAAALLCCAGFVIGSAPGAAAARSGALTWAYNRAALVNYLDDSDRSRSAFDVRVGNAAGVVASNQALANSRCDRCRTVAVAFQVVVTGGAPTDVLATNDSAAINEGCTGCAALALAYQFVVIAEDRLRLSAEGRRQLDAAEDDLRDLLAAAPADAVIVAEAAALAKRVERVLAEELHSSPDVRRDVDRNTPPPRPSPERSAPSQPAADESTPPQPDDDDWPADLWPLSGLADVVRP